MEVENEVEVVEAAEESPWERYHRLLAPVMQEADERDEIADLVGTLADGLAYYAVEYGQVAMADMLSQFGGYVQQRVAMRDGEAAQSSIGIVH